MLTTAGSACGATECALECYRCGRVTYVQVYCRTRLSAQAVVLSVLHSWQNFQRAQTSGTGHPAFSDTADVAARPAAERREQLDALHVLQVSPAELIYSSAARFNSLLECCAALPAIA